MTMKLWQKIVAIISLIIAYAGFYFSSYLMSKGYTLFAFLSVFTGLFFIAIAVSLWYFNSVLPSNDEYYRRKKLEKEKDEKPST